MVVLTIHASTCRILRYSFEYELNTLFDSRPLEITLQYLEHNYLQKFLISPMFKNYIKELIGTITVRSFHIIYASVLYNLLFQASPRSLSSVSAAGASASTSSAFSRDSDERSDCSSEVSGHASMLSPLRSHNTLLATHDTVRTPDSSQADQNPDLLWRRTPVRNDIGRISSIGRYESTVDHAPDTNREQGTKQTSRLVPQYHQDTIQNFILSPFMLNECVN